MRRLPLEFVHEPKPGKNAALNATLDRLEGDLMIQADDDVLPCRDWLVHLRRAADENPGRTLFGGTVEPEWPGALPRWLTERSANFPILYATVKRPAGPCALTDIYGPNWAVRTAVFGDGICFNERIGPDSTQKFYPMGSETEFFHRLEEKGHLGWFAPEAIVRHIVRPEQLAEGWILDRAYRNGRGVGLTRPPRCATGPGLGGLPLGLLARLGVYRGLASLARPLPASALRLRLMFQDRWFTGLADSLRDRPSSAPALSRLPALANRGLELMTTPPTPSRKGRGAISRRCAIPTSLTPICSIAFRWMRAPSWTWAAARGRCSPPIGS